jgi:hypothetical protein
MISDFGQELAEINHEYPPIWELLARSGKKVGLFGSLHSYPLPENVERDYAFYVPDTFAAGPECFPENLSAFQAFNLAMVDRSARNVSKGIAMREAADFLLKAPALGLRGSTALDLSRQMAIEQFKPERTVRRRTSQVQIAFDFFMKLLRRERPDAVFFFTNHVASSLHRYWPALFPSDYDHRFWTDDWEQKWRGEIRFAMNVADHHLRELMRFVDNDPRYALVVTTSMGQGPVSPTEAIRTQLYFRDIRRFMCFLGFADDEWKQARAMAPYYTIRINSQLAQIFENRVAELRINGNALDCYHAGQGVFRVALGHENLDPDSVRVNYGAKVVTLEEVGMENVAIQDESGSYAYHVPQGSMLIYGLPWERRAAKSECETFSTVEVAPAVLANYGVPRPGYMVEPSTLSRLQDGADKVQLFH